MVAGTDIHLGRGSGVGCFTLRDIVAIRER